MNVFRVFFFYFFELRIGFWWGAVDRSCKQKISLFLTKMLYLCLCPCSFFDMELENGLEEDAIYLTVAPKKKSRCEPYRANCDDSFVQKLSPQISAENADGSQVSKRKTSRENHLIDQNMSFLPSSKVPWCKKAFQCFHSRFVQSHRKCRRKERGWKIASTVKESRPGARYHSSCRSQYVYVRSTNQSASNEEDVYVRAFDVLAREIETEGKVLNMTPFFKDTEQNWKATDV